MTEEDKQNQTTENQEQQSKSTQESQNNQQEPQKNNQQQNSDSNDSGFDMASFINEIKDEIAADEANAKSEDLRSKKELAKQIYKDMQKNFTEQEKKYQEQISQLQSQNDSFNKRLEKMSDGSKSDNIESNPFGSEIKPLTQKQRMTLIKEDLVKRGILNSNALYN